MEITTLTKDMITTALNTELSAIKMVLLVLGGIFAVLIIVAFIKLIKDHSNAGNKYTIIGIAVVMAVLLIPIWMLYQKYDAINYSIKNNSWTVKKDMIIRKITNSMKMETRNITLY